jgi:hypothetical protein
LRCGCTSPSCAVEAATNYLCEEIDFFIKKILKKMRVKYVLKTVLQFNGLGL